MNDANHTQVAVGVIIARGGKVLLMKRKGSVGEGTWSIPGGKVDFREDPTDAATRETLEETGLNIGSLELLGYTNDVHPENNSHFVTFNMYAHAVEGDAIIKEPQKCSDMQWFNPENLPSPIFKPTAMKLTEEVLTRIKNTI